MEAAEDKPIQSTPSQKAVNKSGSFTTPRRGSAERAARPASAQKVPAFSPIYLSSPRTTLSPHAHTPARETEAFTPKPLSPVRLPVFVRHLKRFVCVDSSGVVLMRNATLRTVASLPRKCWKSASVQAEYPRPCVLACGHLHMNLGTRQTHQRHYLEPVLARSATLVTVDDLCPPSALA